MTNIIRIGAYVPPSFCSCVPTPPKKSSVLDLGDASSAYLTLRHLCAAVSSTTGTTVRKQHSSRAPPCNRNQRPKHGMAARATSQCAPKNYFESDSESRAIHDRPGTFKFTVKPIPLRDRHPRPSHERTASKPQTTHQRIETKDSDNLELEPASPARTQAGVQIRPGDPSHPKTPSRTRATRHWHTLANLSGPGPPT